MMDTTDDRQLSRTNSFSISEVLEKRKSAKRQASSLLRCKKEIKELVLEEGIRIDQNFDNNTFLVHFKPEIGNYATHEYTFRITIPEDFPYVSPVVLCCDPLFHPNVSPDGRISVAILGDDWRPIFSLSSLFGCILRLLEEPETDFEEYVINKEAYQIMSHNYPLYVQIARGTISPQEGMLQMMKYMQMKQQQQQQQEFCGPMSSSQQPNQQLAQQGFQGNHHQINPFFGNNNGGGYFSNNF